MNYTFATVIIADADRAAAQADFGDGFFNTGLSSDGQPPATHWMSSGPFDNAEMDKIVNVAAWPRRVYFGQDWQAAIDAEGLSMMFELAEMLNSQDWPKRVAFGSDV